MALCQAALCPGTMLHVVGASPPQPQAAGRGFQGCWSACGPTPSFTVFPLSSVPRSRAPLGTGPPTCWLVLLYWEKYLLYPQLKVDNHPASSVVRSPGGK